MAVSSNRTKSHPFYQWVGDCFGKFSITPCRALHESVGCNKRSALHLLAHYCLDLSKLLNTDWVVPVVIFLRSGFYPHELNLGGDRDNYLGFHYLICVLSTIPYEQYKESDNIVARLNLSNMKYAAEEKECSKGYSRAK